MSTITRRGFVQACAVALAAAGARALSCFGAAAAPTPSPPVPLKLAIRAASMKMAGDIGVIQTAASIPGIRGVELQVTAGARNLRDWDVVRQYKRESDRWDIRIPSLAGIWDKGVNILSPNAPRVFNSVFECRRCSAAALFSSPFSRTTPPT